MTGFLHAWGFFWRLECRVCFTSKVSPKGLTAAAATQPSPDKSRTMHHVLLEHRPNME